MWLERFLRVSYLTVMHTLRRPAPLSSLFDDAQGIERCRQAGITVLTWEIAGSSFQAMLMDADARSSVPIPRWVDHLFPHDLPAELELGLRFSVSADLFDSWNQVSALVAVLHSEEQLSTWGLSHSTQ